MIQLELNASGISMRVHHVEMFVRIRPRCRLYLVTMGWGESPTCTCSEFRRSGRRRTCRHIAFVKNCHVITPRPPQPKTKQRICDESSRQ